jgi:hypothetical protein
MQCHFRHRIDGRFRISENSFMSNSGSAQSNKQGSDLRLQLGYPRGALTVKRIAIKIRSKKNPEEVTPGYLLLHELGAGLFSFFSTKKYNQAEQLTVHAVIDGEAKDFQLKLSNCHEQISSGRIMTDVPQEGQPFPTRTFYRCFAKPIEFAATGPKLVEQPAEAPTAIIAKVVAEVAAVENAAAEIAPVADAA